MLINSSIIANGKEITQDNVKMHLYSVPVKSNECSKKSITVYDFDGNFYLNLDDIKDFTRCTLTEEEDTITLTHGLREIVINKSTGRMTDSDIIDQGTVSLIEYDSKYLCEGIPMLEYLGANCTINEHDELEIFMPAYTIWESIMPDYLDYYFDIGKLYGGEDKVTLSLTLDTLADIFDGVSGHGIFANADTHLEDALYEVLDVDVMKYASAQEIATTQNEKINSFLASTISETVLDTSDNVYDAVYEILDYYSRFYISSKNDILLDMMENTDNLDRASELASQIKQQVYTQSAIKTNLNKANNVQGLLDIGMLAFDTSITAFNMMQYNDDTKYLFARTINEDMFDYANYHDVHWNNVSDRISNTLKSTQSIVANTAIDNVVDFTLEKVAEKGTTKALSAFTSKSSIYATAVQIGLFVASLINYKSNQAFSADMNAIWLNSVQYDVAMLVSQLLVKERDEYKFSNAESLEKLKDMLTLYYRITIAFSENIAKSIDEFGTNNKQKWVSWFSSSTEESVCNYTAAYLYRITNCTVIPIVDYSSLSDELLTNEWISGMKETSNTSHSNDDLEQHLNNMGIPVSIYTYFFHYSDSKRIDIHDPYTFWMMLSFYATMEMDDESIKSSSKLAERYKDDEQGEMLVLSEEEVQDAVNAMMPGITKYPDFPNAEYEKPYKKDGNYYFPLIDLDTESTRMTDIKINDDGTATAMVEAFSYSTGEIYETYQINLVKNDKINLNSPEPYPYCIESINVYNSQDNTTKEVMDQTEPSSEEGEVTPKVVSCWENTAIITKQGDLLMCGHNDYEKLGYDGNDSWQFLKVKDNVRDVFIGASDREEIAVITKDNKLLMWNYCYGEKEFVPILDNVDSFVSSNFFSAGFTNAAVTKDGKLYMWGKFYSPDGIGSVESEEPKHIMNNVKQISINEESIGVVTTDGNLLVWGSNEHGQLGTGNTQDVMTSTNILNDISMVSIGEEHSAAIDKEGNLYTWGENKSGELADGSTYSNYYPTIVMTDAKEVVADEGTTYVVDNSGKLYSCGSNFQGALGLGATYEDVREINKLTEIMSDVVDISAMDETILVLTENGDVYGFGNNQYGQLGVGNTTEYPFPMLILNIDSYEAMTSEERSSEIDEAVITDDTKIDLSFSQDDQLINVTLTVPELDYYLTGEDFDIDVEFTDNYVVYKLDYDADDYGTMARLLVSNMPNGSSMTYTEKTSAQRTINGDSITWSFDATQAEINLDNIKYSGYGIWHIVGLSSRYDSYTDARFATYENKGEELVQINDNNIIEYLYYNF